MSKRRRLILTILWLTSAAGLAVIIAQILIYSIATDTPEAGWAVLGMVFGMPIYLGAAAVLTVIPMTIATILYVRWKTTKVN